MIKKIINHLLKLLNLKIVSASSDQGGLGYISAKDTVKNATGAGLSVCDYVEKEWGQIGETAKVIKELDNLGVFRTPNPAICEIGAGTGRYMEKVIEKCGPVYYESYETAQDWSDWLQKTYAIKSLPSDGKSLSATKDNSIDILHAHGVFVYIPFFDSLRYFNEIDRVTKKSAFIVFDCITEDCLDDLSLKAWVNSEYNYPRPLSEKFILESFPKEKYNLSKTFHIKYGQGKSKYFVFKKID